MKREKSKSGFIVLVLSVLVLSILVLTLSGCLAYDKISSGNGTKTNDDLQAPVVDHHTKEESNTTETIDENGNSIKSTKEDSANETLDENNIQEEPKEKHFYDIKDLNVKALPEYGVFADISKNTNVVETEYFGVENDYRASLDLSGTVTVLKYGKTENEKTISGKLNVTGVMDMVQFNVPSMVEEQLLYLLTDDGNVYCYRIGDIAENSFHVTKVESVSNVKKLFISNFSKENAGGSWALFAITGDHDCIMIQGESV